MFIGAWIVYLVCAAPSSSRCVETYEVRATTMQGAIVEAQRQQDDKRFEWETPAVDYTIDPFSYGKLK